MKDEVFCLRRHPPQLKYWMPIHYDTIEDGLNKNLIFYSLNIFLTHCIPIPVREFRSVPGMTIIAKCDKSVCA